MAPGGAALRRRNSFYVVRAHGLPCNRSVAGARFVWLGAGHLAALAATAALVGLSVAVLRARPGLGPLVRAVLAFALVALTASTLALYARHTPLQVWDLLALNI
jgi:hypothetical protein